MSRISIALLLLIAPLVVAQTEWKREIIKFDQFEKLVDQQDDVLYVINFWATWCGPCVKELPDFMAVNEAMKDRKDFKMILVSLDEKSNWQSEVIPFAANNNLNVDIYLLDELRRMNYWIPRVDKKWMGSIPATVFYKNGKKLRFVEKQLHKDALEAIIKEVSAL
ncbi:MAG: TlpA family protein disulfide reductase [Bacteroidales bacterium]|jgi:thiol-disulfide isomerase/thioredoxin|nr:TlpA family protein disulfide reductase [Bacteroidales bacterium]